MLRHTIWNVLLALVPVVLGSVIPRIPTKTRFGAVVVWPVLFIWAVFVPNTCYLLTEGRHLLFDNRFVTIIGSARYDNSGQLTTAKWALLFLGYSSLGMLLFVLSIRPVDNWWNQRKRTRFPVGVVFFLLISLAVYLGLIVRLNSWDVLSRPYAVWSAIGDGFGRPSIRAAILVFAGVLWLAYAAGNLWVEAFELKYVQPRLARRK